MKTKEYTAIKSRSGFTLIEMIIVIAIIAIIAGAIFVAIDPARRLQESRNSVRSNDVVSILDAVMKYQADEEGSHYSTVAALTAGEYSQIGTATSGCNTGCDAQTTEAACVDLSGIGSNYLANVPVDPSIGSDAKTGYYLSVDTNGAVTVGACAPEGEGAGGSDDAPEIEVTR